MGTRRTKSRTIRKGAGGKRYPNGETGRNSLRGGGRVPHRGNANLPYFAPKRAHLLLQVVYGDFPYHNDGAHMDGVVTYDAIWRC